MDIEEVQEMDIWVKKSIENYHKIETAFEHFKMPMFDMTEERFMHSENEVFTFGKSPVAIDLITSLKGLNFDEVYPYSYWENFENMQIRLIHLNHLIQAKKASGRHRDLNDIEHLT